MKQCNKEQCSKDSEIIVLPIGMLNNGKDSHVSKIQQKKTV